MSSSTITDAPPRRWVRVLLTVICLGFAAFWIYALFFASKESVNRVDDEAWAARAETICTAAQTERQGLIDLRPVDESEPALLVEKAAIVDRATDILDAMIDDLEASPPTDPKGAEIVPLWIADYRTYLDDRRAYSDRLRHGELGPFRETPIDGIPISEKLETFAGDNEMGSCAPPSDLSI
jgi:hypothetical protein